MSQGLHAFRALHGLRKPINLGSAASPFFLDHRKTTLTGEDEEDHKPIKATRLITHSQRKRRLNANQQCAADGRRQRGRSFPYCAKEKKGIESYTGQTETFRVMDVDRIDHTALHNRFLSKLVETIPAEMCIQLASLIGVLRDHPNCERRRGEMYRFLLKSTGDNIHVAAELVAFLPRIEVTLAIPVLVNYIRCKGRFSPEYIARMVDKSLEERTFDFVRRSRKKHQRRQSPLLLSRPLDLLSYVKLLKPSTAKNAMLCFLEPSNRHFNALIARDNSLNNLPLAAMAGRIDDQMASLHNYVLPRVPSSKFPDAKLIAKAALADVDRSDVLSRLLPSIRQQLVTESMHGEQRLLTSGEPPTSLLAPPVAPHPTPEINGLSLQTIRMAPLTSPATHRIESNPRKLLPPSAWGEYQTALPVSENKFALASYLGAKLSDIKYPHGHRSLRRFLFQRKQRFFRYGGSSYILTRSQGYIRLTKPKPKKTATIPAHFEEKKAQQIMEKKEKAENKTIKWRRAALFVRLSKLVRDVPSRN